MPKRPLFGSSRRPKTPSEPTVAAPSRSGSYGHEFVPSPREEIFVPEGMDLDTMYWVITSWDLSRTTAGKEEFVQFVLAPGVLVRRTDSNPKKLFNPGGQASSEWQSTFSGKPFSMAAEAEGVMKRDLREGFEMVQEPFVSDFNASRDDFIKYLSIHRPKSKINTVGDVIMNPEPPMLQMLYNQIAVDRWRQK